MPDASSSDQNSGKTAVLDGFLALADGWVSQRADDRGVAWFRGAIHDVAHAANERALSVAIGLAPRRLGKADLSLSEAELARAEALRPGLDPSDWSIDQLARIALMTASFSAGQILGPSFAGHVYDLTGSLAVPSLAAAGALVIAAVLSLRRQP